MGRVTCGDRCVEPPPWFFFFSLMDPSTFPAPNGRLTKAQGDALVYSTLCGFMLVGLWAGVNTRSKREFISGVRTQPGT